MWPHEKPETHFTSHRLLLDNPSATNSCRLKILLTAASTSTFWRTHQISSVLWGWMAACAFNTRPSTADPLLSRIQWATVNRKPTSLSLNGHWRVVVEVMVTWCYCIAYLGGGRQPPPPAKRTRSERPTRRQTKPDLDRAQIHTRQTSDWTKVPQSDSLLGLLGLVATE